MLSWVSALKIMDVWFWENIFHFNLNAEVDEEEDLQNDNAAAHSVDSYRLVRRNRKQGSRQNGGGGGRSSREFCRCKRGPVGYPGTSGKWNSLAISW